MAVCGQRHSLTAFPPRKNPGTYRNGACWAPVPFRTDVKKRRSLASTGFRIPNRPAHIKSLYRLGWPSPISYTRKSRRANFVPVHAKWRYIAPLILPSEIGEGERSASPSASITSEERLLITVEQKADLAQVLVWTFVKAIPLQAWTDP
jgi:hypothetical protein